MSVYLKDIPLKEALNRFFNELNKYNLHTILGKETIPLDENALGRVLAEPVWAKISSPHYHASAMDGFALRAEETDGASPTSPKIIEVGTQAKYLDTGDPLPSWANCVVPIENIEPLDDHNQLEKNPRNPAKIRIRASFVPWKNVRPMGEDMVATQLVLPAGHVLRPVDLGAIAGCGHDEIVVAKKPRVAILPTGTELVEIGQTVKTGDIIEYNSLVLATQVLKWGGKAKRYPITADDFEKIKERVEEASKGHDLILLNAGSSAGSEDYSANVVAELGKLLVHGVAVRPGHPVILGVIYKNKDKVVPIIGVPGYPVSAALTGEIFVEPLLDRWLGRVPHEPIEIKAKLTRKLTSPPGDDDYIRVAVGRVGDRVLATPLHRGAGVITSLVRADGITIVPSGSQGIPAGEEISVRLYRSQREIDKTIFAIGSHDMTLDIMAQYLALHDRRLASANVGSLGGLIALHRNEAHMAGAHLLDPETGQYNLAYIKKYLPGIPVMVVELVERQQGLIVNKGNPKGIKKIEDIAKSDVQYINRQRGAGTRILLDYQLSLLDIDPNQILGYSQEEYTHLAVAAAISSGRADCGLGIAAAAFALDLDFIPLFNERYDLIIPQVYANSVLMKPVFELLHNEMFKQTVLSLPGYKVEKMGTIIAEID
ncbi:MAG TPA: molybdopterin biosynthesis protein [Anaerolineae bacterium]|nr:molybdopterin biosynthesis protein [Anaerolineae bacterium]